MMKPLLIPLTYFCLQTWLGIPQAKCEEELNMTENAFDDQYLGCAKEMEEKAHKLLTEEMSPPFSTVWQNARKKWEDVKSTSPLRAYKDEYGIALVAYTDKTEYIEYDGKTFSTTFKAAVKGAGASRAYYMANFKFKAFHYYLTRALQLLREGCKTVYRGDSKSFEYKKGDIRFGHFASSSINKKVAEGFRTKRAIEKGTLFTIRTCFGVKIQALSYNPDQEEVLIPVHEKFSVSPKGKNHFDLQSTKQTCSYFNCAYLGGEKIETCVNNSATRGGLVFPGVLSPSLFGGSIILVHVAALKLFAGF
ncbi:T-cell ecto-ADP-ribosyltransferase 2-like [Malaclemys terrapin pileata]|uniref:T-cell ecto-ADP-ribosyltransferase 2-like n=1 Tax=Malaclemys terrapin pileata TaxID=2991368 RepID=UPI0023A7AADF|nr:T-cell ecto-ADP-ribosyltransferase 2-like [Malaclemys terrapin pileata]